MSVGRICTRDVETVDLNDTATTAARRMLDHNVGTLLVVDDDGHALGIVTDRDLALRVVAACRDASKAKVWEVMSQLPTSIPEDTPVDEALRTMRSGCFRRLPVVNREGRLVGVVSIDDVLMHLAKEFSEIKGLLWRESPEGLATA